MAETLVSRAQFALHRALARLSYGMVNSRHPLRHKAWAAATEVPARIPTATTPLECMELFQAVASCEKIPGDLAEAGVFRGGTAAVMLSASTKKRLHLFDTFQGLPNSDAQFRKGEYFGSLDAVRRNLNEWADRVEYHPGIFPDSTSNVSVPVFSFVHLDLDLYEPTLSALQWFLPRLHRGGVIFSHDYPFSNGVVQAFTEFFADRDQPFFPLAGNQCMAVKL